MKIKMMTITALCAALAACGGGSGDDAGSPPPPTQGPTAEGYYSGTATDGTVTADIDMFVLEDGTYYAVFTDADSNFLAFNQGTAQQGNGSFTASNARIFAGRKRFIAEPRFRDLRGAPVHCGDDGRRRRHVSFSASFDTSVYNYDTPAVLADITGNWELNLVDGETAPLTISNTGAIAGASSGGCHFSGTVKPRASGKNLFDLAVTFGAAPCALPGQSTKGIMLSARRGHQHAAPVRAPYDQRPLVRHVHVRRALSRRFAAHAKPTGNGRLFFQCIQHGRHQHANGERSAGRLLRAWRQLLQDREGRLDARRDRVAPVRQHHDADPLFGHEGNVGAEAARLNPSVEVRSASGRSIRCAALGSMMMAVELPASSCFNDTGQGYCSQPSPCTISPTLKWPTWVPATARLTGSSSALGSMLDCTKRIMSAAVDLMP